METEKYTAYQRVEAARSKGRPTGRNYIDNLISIRDLANLIAGLDPNKKVKVCYAEGVEQKLQYLPFKLGIMDVDRIMSLGWNPQVGVEDAFRYTLESFLQRKA